MISAGTVPSFHEELDRLRPILPHLGEALEQALGQARRFFEDQNALVDPYLAPCLVRYHAKTFLVEHGYSVEDLDIISVPNNGLSVRYKGRSIRIWKGDADTLPLPGRSRHKLDFLNQQLALDSMLPDPTGYRHNSMLLWSPDCEYRLQDLYLSLPKSATMIPQNTDAYWTERIPLEALIRVESPKATETRDDHLHIELPHEEDAEAEAK